MPHLQFFVFEIYFLCWQFSSVHPEFRSRLVQSFFFCQELRGNIALVAGSASNINFSPSSPESQNGPQCRNLSRPFKLIIAIVNYSIPLSLPMFHLVTSYIQLKVFKILKMWFFIQVKCFVRNIYCEEILSQVVKRLWWKCIILFLCTITVLLKYPKHFYFLTSYIGDIWLVNIPSFIALR